jgi:deoxyhypusine synthase
MSDGVASTIPNELQEAVLLRSEPMPADSVQVKGHDFSEVWKEGKPVDYHALLSSYRTSGFQATNFGLAVEQINLMLKARGDTIPDEKKKPYLHEPGDRPVTNCTIFLGYTSNLISSGIRDTLRYLVRHDMVDVVVSTAGGIEEDFIKCLAPTFLGDFSLPGRELRLKGINRIGNLLVPNDNYVKFEEWIMPIFDQMLEEQKTKGVVWTPSKMIARLGKEINNPDSVYYWAYKNNIPVFCPALTDGSMGDMIYIHSYKNPGLVVDIAQGEL